MIPDNGGQEGKEMRTNSSNSAYRLSFCALMAALGTAIMLCSNLIPILTYASPLFASLTLIPVLYEFGKKYAWMTWAVTTALALILCADREAALFYLFLGYYPIIRPDLDRIRPKAARVLAKLGVFAAGIGLMVLSLTFVVGVQDFKEEMWLNIAFYVMMVGIMFLFDRTYAAMTIVYEKRFRRLVVRRGTEKSES